MNQYYQPQGFSFLPPVVKNLLIINILLFFGSYVIGTTFDINLSHYLGLHFWGAKSFYPFQFLTYMFMHGSLNHLFFNMFAVWMFGALLENYWGSKKFLQFYLFTGFGGGLFYYIVIYIQHYPQIQIINSVLDAPTFENILLFDKEILTKGGFKNFNLGEMYNFQYLPAIKALYVDPTDTKNLVLCKNFVNTFEPYFLDKFVTVGASGALFGLLMAFGMLFPNNYIYLFFLLPIKAKHFVIIYGAAELISGVAKAGNSDIAHFAHLGGMLFGFIFLKLLSKQRKKYSDF